MKTIYSAKVFVAAAAGFLLVGCASSRHYQEEFSGLSCSELDQKLGAAKQKRKQARWGQVGSALEEIGETGSDKTGAQLEGVGHGVAETDAENRIDAIRKIKNEEGCE